MGLVLGVPELRDGGVAVLSAVWGGAAAGGVFAGLAAVLGVSAGVQRVSVCLCGRGERVERDEGGGVGGAGVRARERVVEVAVLAIVALLVVGAWVLVVWKLVQAA